MIVAAPDYLIPAVERYANLLGAENWIAGRTRGAPSLLLIYDQHETGAGLNEEVLREAREVIWDEQIASAALTRFDATDLLLFPGIYPAAPLIRTAAEHGARIHVDAQYNLDITPLVEAAGGALNTVFISLPLGDRALADPEIMWKAYSSSTQTLVLKENRGGSRVFFGNDSRAESPAFPMSSSAHGVGVGDCFDCIWIAARDDSQPHYRLARASYYAALYANTYNFEEFERDARDAATADNLVVSLAGLRLRWENRPRKRIYIAAPDFPGVNTATLDDLCTALRHHGFDPLRPILEHGLYTEGVSASEARELYEKDVAAILNAALLIAVPITNDPGTFAELGFAQSRGIPTVLWEQENVPKNLFVQYTAAVTCRTLAEVIDATYAAVGLTTSATST
jgi:nucleoside 2-deoxyribosyltransferase